MCNDEQVCLPFWYLPDALVLSRGNGTVLCPIRTEFGVGITLRALFSEAYYISRPQKLLGVIAERLFSSPDTLRGVADEELLAATVWYLADGRIPRREIMARLWRGTDGKDTAERTDGNAVSAALFSYKWDMPTVWTSCLAAYGIDLMRTPYCRMHLWQFDALIRGLAPDSALSRLCTLRGTALSDIGDAEVRAATAAEKLRVRIPAEAALNEMYNDTHMSERRTV